MFLLIWRVLTVSKMYLQISIHLMFLLIFSSDRSTPSSITHFNTSHVSINHRRLPAYLCSRLHFNTSHVSINQFLPKMGESEEHNFNTSHVSINLKELQQRKRTDGISIHLMFLLIAGGRCPENGNSHFNTSHVSINQGAGPGSPEADRSFQYISCFY